MNILIIPTNDWTRAPGHGHIDFIAEKLVERGHRIYVWHFDFFRNQPIKRKAEKVKLIRPKTLWVRNIVLFYVLNVPFQIPKFFKVIRDLNIEIIINENPFYGLLAFICARVLSKKVLKVFDFSDYFPESASVYYNDSMHVLRRIVETITLTITKLNVKLADICLAVCNSLVRTIREIDDEKACYLLTNGVNTSQFSVPKEQSVLRERLELSGDIIAFMGIIEDWLDLVTPIKAMKTLQNRFPQVKLMIIGPSLRTRYQQRMEELIVREDLQQRVIMTGYIPDEELVQYLSAAKCCLMPYKTESFSSSIRLPEKLFVYSACGKPILSTSLPEVMRLRAEHVFFYQDVDEFVDVTSFILSDKDLEIKLSASARRFAKNHDFNVLGEKLEKILIKHSSSLHGH